MRRGVLGLLMAIAALTTLAAFVYAQRFDPRFDSFFAPYIPKNDPPDTEFVFARWQYTGRGRFGGTGWSHDYPVAEEHINQIMNEATLINVESMSYKIIALSDPEIFKYPFSYISEAGEMALTELEVTQLREYINRGGFVMVDDFDGPRDLEVFRRNMKRAFPDRDIFPIDARHPIFDSFYTLDATDPPSPYDYGPGNNPMFYGYPDGHGGIAMIICHDNDIGDFWEWIDQRRFPLEPSAQSLRFGINFVIYAMTH